MLEALGHEVEEVYRLCVGDILVLPTTIQMLVAIECHLQQLMDNMESVPQDIMDHLNKAKDRERMMRWVA